jgi:hypothetical protein
MKNPLQGQYERLRAELAAAYEKPEWSVQHIDRLANELAALERRLAAGTSGGDVYVVNDPRPA